ncbi:hypothetical protein V1505DRAFT_353090 [Lipomyces doorenjongii]
MVSYDGEEYGDSYETRDKESVDLGDVTESQSSRWPEQKLTTSERGRSCSQALPVRKGMSPFVELLSCLDLACVRRGHDGDTNNERIPSQGLQRFHLCSARTPVENRVLPRLDWTPLDLFVDSGAVLPEQLTMRGLLRTVLRPVLTTFQMPVWRAGQTAVKTDIRSIVASFESVQGKFHGFHVL